MKRCSKCGQLLPLECFSKEPTYKDGYKNICKKCHKEYAKKYRKLQKEKREILLGKRDPDYEKHIGGYRVYVLNHTKRGEFKYNVVSTKGSVFHTNNKGDFLSFLTEI